jgi:hypothetical protein
LIPSRFDAQLGVEPSELKIMRGHYFLSSRVTVSCSVILYCAVAMVNRLSIAFANAPTSQPDATEFKIEDSNHPVMIPVTWQGESGYFILDTGSAVSTLDSFTFPNLREVGKKATIDTGYGQIRVELFEPPDLSISPVHLRNGTPIVQHDLSFLSQKLGRKIIGLLGVSAIGKLVVQIDFDKQLLKFLPPDYETHPDWGRAFGFQGVEGVPAIIVSLSDGDYPFRLDTGWMGSIVMPTPGFEKALALAHPATIAGPVWTLRGMQNSRYLRWPNSSMLGWDYPNLIVAETQADTPAFGLSFLSRHMITFDFPRYLFYIKKGEQFGRTDEINMSGLTVIRLNSHDIAQVDVGGPADEAGIRDGDVILSVDGKAADTWDLADLAALLSSKNDCQISITYWREGETQTVAVKLRRRL